MAAAQPEYNQLAELIIAHEERLGILRIQAARHGDDTPPHIVAEIARITDELSHLKQAASYPVSPALMEELGPAGRSQLWMSHIMRLDADIGRVRRAVEQLDEQTGARFDELRNHIDGRLDTILLTLASAREPVQSPHQPSPQLARPAPLARGKAGRR
jgi:hypothetical protein